MRSLTSSAQQKIQSKTATEPIVIIEVQWASGSTRKYSDKDHQTAKGKIIDISEFSGAQRIKGGQSTSMTIVVDDSDEDIRNLLETNDGHKAFAKVWQSFEGLNSSSNFLLFSGHVNSPIIWEEGTRTYRFTIVSDVEGREVGFSPESGTFDYVDPSIIGKPWPICFGSPYRVPAQRITPRVEARSLIRYKPITIEAINALEEKVQKYALLLAEVGLADNALNIADIVVVILNDDYLAYLEEIAKAYTEFSTVLEDLVITNPDQETNLSTFVDNVFGIAVKTYYIEKINEFLVQLSEKVTITQEEADDLEKARLTELDKTPFHNSTFVSEIISLRNAKQGEAFSLLALQTSLIGQGNDLAAEIIVLEASNDTLETAMTTFSLTTVEIEAIGAIPQGTQTVTINKQRFTGTVTDTTFVPDGQPTPLNLESVTFAVRENSRPNEFWINDWSTGETPDLRNRFLLTAGNDVLGNIQRRVIFVTQQEGNRCFFSPLVYQETGLLGEDRVTYGFKLYDDGDIIEQMSPTYLKEAWEPLLSPAPLIIPDFVTGLYQMVVSDWFVEVGDDIEFGSGAGEIYIANLYESTEVTEVLAYRDDGGKRILSPLPSHYYTVDLAYSIAGHTTTAIKLQRKLSEYEGENWEDEIFVSLTSSLGNNTADVIEWILETWTDIVADDTTFGSVESALSDFPSDFALLTKQDAISLVEDIAWQARCTVWVVNNIAYIKYLSTEPTTDITIDERYIEATTLQMTLTATEEIVTVLEGTWRSDYATVDENKVVLRNNVPIYGVHKEEHSFFIYNEEEYVQRSMTFWLIRKSNTWKKIVFQGFLNLLEVEVFDTIQFSLDEDFFSDSPVKSVVESIDYDSNNNSLRFVCWLPIRSGFMVEYPFAWMSSAPPGLEYPTVDDPYAGGG